MKNPSDCATCAFYALNRRLPPDQVGAHCPYCHRTWAGRVQAHCRHVYPDGHHCCAHFASPNVANYHWGSGKSGAAPAYDAKHLEPADVPALRLGEDGVWHGLPAEVGPNRPGDPRRGHLESFGASRTGDPS